MKKKITVLLILSIFLGCQYGCDQGGKSKDVKSKHQPIVAELMQLVDDNTDIKNALQTSVETAGRLNITTLGEYYNYLDGLVTMIPTARNILPQILEYYYLIDQSPDGFLQTNELFQQWTHKFADEWGLFMDTPGSVEGLETFYNDPSFHMDDYYQGPSGWLTFNQFFARHVKPGKRPVAGLCDDKVIVSPADSEFAGVWEINDEAEIVVKGMKYSVFQLLDGSPYQDRFRGGTFIHAFLNVNDYHRYHVPVGGVVKEVRDITGRVVLEVIKKEDGSLGVIDGTGYQFTQQRGLIVLESPIGLVATLPIGMAQVSSCNLHAEEGATLAKGEEFGYFQFGGSDIIVMFEPGKVKITAEPGTHYNQGVQIGYAIK
nr:phosphatidylserine decarboxylase [Bacteroidota bacterium]